MCSVGHLAGASFKGVFSDAEIRQPHAIVLIKQKVVWLDIAMENAEPMHIGQAI